MIGKETPKKYPTYNYHSDNVICHAVVKLKVKDSSAKLIYVTNCFLLEGC